MSESLTCSYCGSKHVEGTMCMCLIPPVCEPPEAFDCEWGEPMTDNTDTDPAARVAQDVLEYLSPYSPLMPNHEDEVAKLIRTAYAHDMIRLDKLKAENDRYRERLLVSPQGDDKIDELEEANEILRNNCEVAKAKLESLLHEKGE
jgi:hypothetical protein